MKRLEKPPGPGALSVEGLQKFCLSPQQRKKQRDHQDYRQGEYIQKKIKR
jgi:hypothetical protein